MLGVDISSSSIKLVELGQDKDGGWVLERCAMEPLEKGWVADGNIEKYEEVATALRRVVKKSGSRAKAVAMALPHSAVITKRIALPGSLNEQELEVQVESEASKYIPFALEEVSLDFCVVGPNPKNPEDVDVLIAASRKEKVEDRQGLAEAAGLTATVVDVESHAARLAAARVIAAVPNLPADALVALIKVGSTSTSLQVIRNDEVLYEREQSFGGSQLTQAIARHYGFSPEEAEVKKCDGDLPADYATAVLQPFVDSLAQEIGRVLHFFFTSTPFHSVHHVLISGGSASLPHIAETVQQQTGYGCSVVDPFAGMQIAGTVVRGSRFGKEAPSYLTACGLAMRRFLL